MIDAAPRARALARPLLLFAAALGAPQALAGEAPCRIRVATFNAALNFPDSGGLAQTLAGGAHEPARKIAAIIQRIRPDVLLLNELDHDDGMTGLAMLRDEYLGRGQFGERVLTFSDAFHAPVNTGVPSGHDLDRNGAIGGAGDAWGFGRFPGQYGMVVLSRLPIDHAAARTFQKFPWIDLPGATLPVDPASGEPYYPASIRAVLRLSSKSHWDVPIRLPNGGALHLLASHPTPPVFDGPEDRNGLRNRDEIAFWRHYVDGSAALVDDAGVAGGLAAEAAFVIAGDLNADPFDGDSTGAPTATLLAHPRINGELLPTSRGAEAKARADGGVNDDHRSPPAGDTADFGDRAPGNLRVDYVLPSADLDVIDAGVFWPLPGEAGAAWIDASDHRLVWVDLACPD